jgi:hypothetical protein
VAADEREIVAESKVVRRLVVSSIAWLDPGPLDRKRFETKPRRFSGEIELCTAFTQNAAELLTLPAAPNSQELLPRRIFGWNVSAKEPGKLRYWNESLHEGSATLASCALRATIGVPVGGELIKLLHAIGSNENKMRCREREGAWQQDKVPSGYKTSYNGRSRSPPSHG